MELHQMVGTVLGVIGLLYMFVFWGSAIWKSVYHYLHDGDKAVGDLCGWIEEKFNGGSEVGIDEYGAYGAGLPVVYAIASLFCTFLTSKLGVFLPITLGTVSILWLSLYTIRGVIRSNKKLDKHSEDKDAHN